MSANVHEPQRGAQGIDARNAWQVYAFRRGARPAAIHSLAFSPAAVRPALLCAASGHGTVHLYRLEEYERCARAHRSRCATVRHGWNSHQHQHRAQAPGTDMASRYHTEPLSR